MLKIVFRESRKALLSYMLLWLHINEHKMDNKEQILGLDIGGVIIDVWQHGNDKTFFSDRYLDTPEIKQAFSSILKLRKHFKDIKYVSHCSDENRARFIGWLHAHDFYAATQSRFEDITYCLHRSDKAAICQKLNIDVFVDDRLEILSSLSSVGRRLLFQPRTEDVEEYKQYLPMVEVVNSWTEVAEKLVPSGRPA
jgi:hypothetical protein